MKEQSKKRGEGKKKRKKEGKEKRMRESGEKRRREGPSHLLSNTTTARPLLFAPFPQPSLSHPGLSDREEVGGWKRKEERNKEKEVGREERKSGPQQRQNFMTTSSSCENLLLSPPFLLLFKPRGFHVVISFPLPHLFPHFLKP